MANVDYTYTGVYGHEFTPVSEKQENATAREDASQGGGRWSGVGSYQNQTGHTAFFRPQWGSYGFESNQYNGTGHNVTYHYGAPGHHRPEGERSQYHHEQRFGNMFQFHGWNKNHGWKHQDWHEGSWNHHAASYPRRRS